MEIEEIRKSIERLGPIVKKAKRPRKEFKQNKEIKNFEDTIKKNYKEFAQEIIENSNGKLLVLAGESFGILLKARGISSNQLRNIFGYVKKIECGIKGNKNEKLLGNVMLKLRLLLPKISYIIGRERNYESKEMLEILRSFFGECIEKINGDKSKFALFVDTFESILSYHKYYGEDKQG